MKKIFATIASILATSQLTAASASHRPSPFAAAASRASADLCAVQFDTCLEEAQTPSDLMQCQYDFDLCASR